MNPLAATLPKLPLGDPRYAAYAVWETSMAPTLKPGDGLIVRPTDRYEGDGLYVLEMLGEPDVWRLQTFPGPQIRMSKDSERFGPHFATVEQVERSILARVCWTCQPECVA